MQVNTSVYLILYNVLARLWICHNFRRKVWRFNNMIIAFVCLTICTIIVTLLSVSHEKSFPKVAFFLLCTSMLSSIGAGILGAHILMTTYMDPSEYTIAIKIAASAVVAGCVQSVAIIIECIWQKISGSVK